MLKKSIKKSIISILLALALVFSGFGGIDIQAASYIKPTAKASESGVLTL